MSNVIVVDFRRGRMTLKEAKTLLGGTYFKKALLEWSIEELERTANHSEACLSGADAAYEAVLRHRLARSADPRPVAPVIKLAA